MAYGQAGVLDWPNAGGCVHLARPGDIDDLTRILGAALRESQRPEAGTPTDHRLQNWAPSEHAGALIGHYERALREWNADRKTPGVAR